MAENLKGKKVAILAADGFEQSELESPRKALEEAGAEIDIVSIEEGTIRGWNNSDWGDEVDVDVTLAEADPDEYDALVLPGGVMNPDKLRESKDAISFIKKFVKGGKPIGAICHGPWTLINAGAVEGLRMTSYSSIRTDLENAGAEWIDAEVVTDNGIVTSRKPADLTAFNRKLIEEIGEGRHSERKTLTLETFTGA
jgi:protease I